MISRLTRAARALATALIDPRGAIQDAMANPAPMWIGAVFLGAAAAVSLGTLPRQLALLDVAVPVLPETVLAAQQEMLRRGLTRLILVDRLVPQPTVLVGAGVLVLLAAPVLMLARDRRAVLIAVALVGLAPLLVDRLGQLILSLVVSLPQVVSPGEAIRLPHRFVTGPLVFWRDTSAAPGWLELLNARVNLVSLWCVAIWVVGMHELSGAKWAAWQVAVPVVSLAGAGVITWAVGPWALALILR